MYSTRMRIHVCMQRLEALKARFDQGDAAAAAELPAELAALSS